MGAHEGGCAPRRPKRGRVGPTVWGGGARGGSRPWPPPDHPLPAAPRGPHFPYIKEGARGEREPQVLEPLSSLSLLLFQQRGSKKSSVRGRLLRCGTPSSCGDSGTKWSISGSRLDLRTGSRRRAPFVCESMEVLPVVVLVVVRGSTWPWGWLRVWLHHPRPPEH